jgi:hypothetical protein
MQVQHQAIRRLGLKELEEIGSGGKRLDLHSRRADQSLERATNGLLVVHDDNERRSVVH